ncbi:MAG: hypothetical protein IPP62_17975 [bacterium]|nr:hypothetical protein [bacterium]
MTTTLTWAHSDCLGSLVRLELLEHGNVCAVLANSTPNNGFFTWTPQRCGEVSTGYRLRCRSCQRGRVMKAMPSS